MDNATNITINIVEPGSDVPVPDTGLFTHGIGGTEASIIATAGIVIVIAIAAIILYLRKKKINLKPSKHTSIILSILAIITSIATFTGLTLNSIYNHTNAKEGNLTVTAEDADFTIEVGNEPVFAVLPVDVKVQESTPAGYTLTAYTENTDLVSNTDSSNIIPMVATSEGELVALKDNTYGLSLSLAKPTSKDEVVYTSLSTVADNPTFITDKDYKATEANDTTTVYYGFYIAPDTPYGTYKSSDIYYNATTNSSKVIFHGNGLYFNNNPEQTTNDVDYITGITEKTAKYSHTPNVNDEGEASGVVGYLGKEINKVVSIPNASKLRIKLSYGGGYLSIYGGYPAGFLSFWQGSHPDYTTNNNADSTIKTCGTSDVTDGKFYGNRNNENDIITTECELEGNAVTFAYWTSGGGPSSGAIYGYYATVTGYDADGNIIYLPGNTQVGGEYKDPAQDLPYIFLGWNEDKEATTATYESKNDIEINLPLTKGKTTELYAIWQHATKIHLDGNGSTSGEIPDKLLKPGEGVDLCGYYYSRDGYIFNNWNTKPDGSGESYGQCYWYTAPADQSVELNLYAQWSPATTIAYDGNGGEGSGPTQTIRAGETSNIYGGYYFNNDGYVFSHWNTEPDGTGTSYYQGDQFTASDQSTTITLYAQWSPATTIVYDGNGGEGNQIRQTIRIGETGSIRGNWGYFNKDGYAFSHWNTEPDGTGTSYYQGDQFTASDQPTTITLYAIWAEDGANTTIIYDGNGADGGYMDNQIIWAGNTDWLRGSNYWRDGYNFTSWNTESDGSGISYNAYEYYTASNNTETITLYAQWEEIPHTTIVYDGNGGEGNGPTQTIRAGETQSIWGNWGYFNKDGYVFSHWNTEPDGTGTSYYQGDQFTASDQFTTITFYAQWSRSTTITFNGNGSDGGSGLEDRYLSPGEGTNFCNDDNYTRTGYSFLGWNTEPDGSGIFYDNCAWYQAPSDKSETITLYAQWTDKAMLDTGTTVNIKLKRLAGNSSAESYIEDTNVTAITRASTLPTDFIPTDDNIISVDGSIIPVYAWYDADTTTIYYYTESDEIIMNPDSSYMFRNFTSLSDATSIADWDTSNVTDMHGMFQSAGRNATTWSIGDLSSWDTSKVTNMSGMFQSAGFNATTWSIGDLSSWDTSKVTDMNGMFHFAGHNATTWSIGDLSSWDTSNVTDMSGMFSDAGYNATTWSIGDLSSWDTSKVTDMNEMFCYAGYNATTWSIGDISSWNTSNVTDMSWMFLGAGSNATTWSIGDLSSWDTSKVTDMGFMFYSSGYNATTFSLDLSSWDTSKVTDMSLMFYSAGYNATTWSITIPPKTGDIDNTTSAFYGQDSSIYADPPYNRFFTLATQANSNTTNTTGSLNSVNNAGSPNQDNSSRNRSVYTTEDVEEIENTENDDSTSSDATSAPSRQEPLGEYQSSNTTEDTNIVIPILIATSITLGTSALVLLIYKSRRREDK